MVRGSGCDSDLARESACRAVKSKRRLVLVGCEFEACVGDELRARFLFRIAGEFSNLVVFEGDLFGRDCCCCCCSRLPFSRAAGPIPDATRNELATGFFSLSPLSCENILVVMSISSSPSDPASLLFSSSSASEAPLRGDEKRASSGSMPCSSRTPVSARVMPVFLVKTTQC